VSCLPRLMLLRCLMTAIMAIALLSTSWHGTALAGSPNLAVHAHSTQGGHKHAVQGQAGHKHADLTKAHAAAQGCCHPACTMAVIPSPAGTSEALLLSAPLQIIPDLMPAAAASSGLDRPPKRA
jgi:hypothetical protein